MSSPPSRNSYLEYKRDNAQIIRWIITTVSNIKQRQRRQERKDPSFEAAEDKPRKPQLVKIDSPAITVASLISLSELIAKSEKSIPTTVFRLFRYVIDARTSAYQFCASIYAEDPDVEINRANKAHKALLDGLNIAYKVLGGLEWEEREAEERKQKPGDEVTDDHELANRFEGLDVDILPSDGETSDNPDKPAPHGLSGRTKKVKERKRSLRRRRSRNHRSGHWRTSSSRIIQELIQRPSLVLSVSSRIWLISGDTPQVCGGKSQTMNCT